jgi:2-succinyl-6-hydroxy-2,4-cyclohexadiene-1-carboxylate synthase
MIEKRIIIDNITINTRYSLNEGQAILFLHFAGGNMNMWNGVLPQFAKDFSVIAPDLRGHGKSDKPMNGYNIDIMANDMYLLLKHLGIEHCHVIGSSLGAEVAISLAAAHPELVLSVVCDGALYNEFGEYGLYNGTDDEIEQKKKEYYNGMIERKEPSFTSREAYIDYQHAKLSSLGLWNSYFQVLYENNVEMNEEGTYISCYATNAKHEYAKAYFDSQFNEYYKRLKCPVLFIVSEEEWKDETIKRIVHSFADMIEISEIKYIENSIHPYVWMQLPDIAYKAVKDFVTHDHKVGK